MHSCLFAKETAMLKPKKNDRAGNELIESDVGLRSSLLPILIGALQMD